MAGRLLHYRLPYLAVAGSSNAIGYKANDTDAQNTKKSDYVGHQERQQKYGNNHK
jgi:hypothetical protein